MVVHGRWFMCGGEGAVRLCGRGLLGDQLRREHPRWRFAQMQRVLIHRRASLLAAPSPTAWQVRCEPPGGAGGPRRQEDGNDSSVGHKALFDGVGADA